VINFPHGTFLPVIRTALRAKRDKVLRSAWPVVSSFEFTPMLHLQDVVRSRNEFIENWIHEKAQQQARHLSPT
jgi:hypothetical protein